MFPASLPHVVTVAAVGSDLKAPFFSSASAAVDLAAPGVGILSATPPQFDEDGTRDGYEAVTRTSFSAPMVAAAAAWLRAARPNLKVDQVASALRASAIDLGSKGWDSATGFGLLSMTGALALRTLAADPHEPNDDMAWVDGRALGRKDSAVWSGGKARRLRALVDKLEDPADVYRIVLPKRAKIRVTLKPRFGDADLAAFTRSATSTADDEQIIGRSRHNGKRRDTLTLRNPSKRSRAAFLVAYIDRDTKMLYFLATTSGCSGSSEAERELALGVGRGQCRERLARLLEAVAALDRHPQVAALQQRAEPVEGHLVGLGHDREAIRPGLEGAHR